MRERGMTAIELVFVLGALALLAGLLLPLLDRGWDRPRRLQCLSNQKQIALAFLLYCNDHEKPFPMELSPAEGGTKDEVLKHNPVANYLVVSNELNTPKILACPVDKKRTSAESFTNLTVRNLSYFINLGATYKNRDTVLIGDRQITLDGIPVRGYVEGANASSFGWATSPHQDGGNMAFQDGSAVQASPRVLREALQRSERTIRLLVP